MERVHDVGATEWFLLIVVVILIPLIIAVAVTLWSLEQARQRNKKNRPNAKVRRVALPAAPATNQPPAPEKRPSEIAGEGSPPSNEGQESREQASAAQRAN